MPIRRRQKKPNADPRQKPNHNHAVVDPMVDPGSPPHRRQARAKADTTRTHHRMVTLAQSSSGGRSASPPQSKTATVMLGVRPVELPPMELSTLCALPRQIRKVDDEAGLAAIEDDVEAILQARLAGPAAREEDVSDLPAL